LCLECDNGSQLIADSLSAVSYAPVSSVQQRPKPGRRCNSHGWARTADRPRASWKLRHTHSRWPNLTWPACRWTCATVSLQKIR